MSKSNTDERKYGYHGHQTIAPQDLEKIRASIMPDCFCYYCVASRKWLKDEKERREGK